MSSSFLTPLIIEYLDGKTYRLCQGFCYQTCIGELGQIKVPEGFKTDFASVPRGLWNIFPPTGEYGKAAVIHDFLYRCTNVDRKICDQVLLEGMEVLGVGWLSRKLVYRAVRLFGSVARKQLECKDLANNSGSVLK